ncbi:MAG: hypothetical protein ACXWP0_18440 [Ktedonobacterales bacterium]
MSSTLPQSLADALPEPAASATLLSSSVSTGSSTYDAYAALRFREFRLLAAGRFLAALGEQMLGVAVGWELYERTHSPLAASSDWSRCCQYSCLRSRLAT